MDDQGRPLPERASAEKIGFVAFGIAGGKIFKPVFSLIRNAGKVIGSGFVRLLGRKTGSLYVDPVGAFSQSEINAAQYLAGQGKNVVLRSPVGTRVGGGTSDLLVDGVRYDVYAPVTTNVNRIISAISSKNQQTQVIVLDLTNSSVPADSLSNALRRVNGAGAKNITDIIILK